jgi:hypothetical protein
MVLKSYHSLSQIFFNFPNICVSVAVFRNILQNILQYMTKDRDTYTYTLLRKLKKIWESVSSSLSQQSRSRKYYTVQFRLKNLYN